MDKFPLKKSKKVIDIFDEVKKEEEQEKELLSWSGVQIDVREFHKKLRKKRSPGH